MLFKVQLFLRRVCHDWDAQSPKMRSALTAKDATPLHISCGMFLHFLDELQTRAPSSHFESFKSSLMASFMAGMMDPELVHAAEYSVPPGDISSISLFRQVCFGQLLIILHSIDKAFWD